MTGKSCFLIGSHLSPDTLSPLLDEAIERHIAEYRVTEFVVGGTGGLTSWRRRPSAGRRSAIPESACGC